MREDECNKYQSLLAKNETHLLPEEEKEDLKKSCEPRFRSFLNLFETLQASY